jgi:hypothetical protein
MLIEKVYPELKLYLGEDTASIVAGNLMADANAVRSFWSSQMHFGSLRKILEGKPFKADGTPYSKFFVDKVWGQLGALNQNHALNDAIRTRDSSEASPLRKLMHSPVTTLTGRIRGGVTFTAARNTPFQGLAADGAKLAMWELTKAGYRVVAFVHDEFVIEVPFDADHTTIANDVERICCSAMQQLVGDVPVECEYSLSDRWYKNATAVWSKDGKLLPWSSSQEASVLDPQVEVIVPPSSLATPFSYC